MVSIKMAHPPDGALVTSLIVLLLIHIDLVHVVGQFLNYSELFLVV